MENLDPSVSKPASIADTSPADSVTVFAVSEVLPANKPLPEVPYYEAVEALLNEPIYPAWRNALLKGFWGIKAWFNKSVFNWGYLKWSNEILCLEPSDEIAPPKPSRRTIESCSQYRGRLVASVYFHPVLAAIHHAFNDHRPLCLSPDMIWLLISQGLANHVNANAEELRSQFVQHEGKVTITVRRDDFVKGSPENPWQEVLGEFSAAIRQQLGEATHDLLVPAFSTTGLVEKAAAEVVLCDAMRSYFEYEFITLCGIPQIKLEGNLTDWQALLKRTQELAQFGLHWWINALIPILKQFVAAVEGKPDKRFWQAMYKLNKEMSGGPCITGWIIAFFPYLQDWQTGQANRKNHLLMGDKDYLQRLRYLTEDSDSHRLGGGLTTAAFPGGLAKVPFRWQYGRSLYNMEFLGGFVGVRQDRTDRCLRPEIGWAVREAV